MLKYPEMSPVMFKIGPLVLRWYGLMYAISFFSLLSIMRRQAKNGFLPLTSQMVERLFLYLVVSILVGARLFYVVFYNPSLFLDRPSEIFAIWHGGLSFHGGFAGVAVASILISRQAKVPWTAVIDTLALCTPTALGLGRIGNFINGELYGRVTELPWGMVFPKGGPLPRHPSQLYESFLEGIVLGLILWALKRRVKRHGVIAASFMVGYAVARILVEFVREPDPQLGLFLGFFTMGQMLSVALLIAGMICLRYSLRAGYLL